MQFPKKIYAIDVVVIEEIGMLLVSLEYLLVITTTWIFPNLVFGRELKMLSAMDSSSLLAGNS